MKRTLFSVWIVSGVLLTGGVSAGVVAFESTGSDTLQLVSLDPATEGEILGQVDERVAAEDLDGAIALLEALSAEGSENPEVYRRLGALYLDAGRLPEDAVEPYTQALELATAAENPEEQALAQRGLAEVNWMMGNTDEATRLLTEARTHYELLGDSDGIAEVEAQLTALSDEPTTTDGLTQPAFRSNPNSNHGGNPPGHDIL